MEHFSSGNRTGYIELPPGFGKTVIASWLTEFLKQNTIIIAPTGEIVNQFRETLQEVTKITSRKLGDKEEVETIEGKTITGQQVVITTHAAFRRANFTKEYTPELYPFLIVDEAHEFIGPESEAKILEHKTGPNTHIIGLTATSTYNIPKARVEVRKVQGREIPVVVTDADHSVRKTIGSEITRITVQEAVDRGMACPIEVWKAIVGVTADNLPGVDPKVRRAEAKEITKQAKIDALSRMINYEVVVNNNVQKFFADKKIIVRCATIQEACDSAEALMASCPGREVFYISGKMSDTERRKELSKFRASSNGILCGADIVGIGLDVPDVSAVFMTKDTKSCVEIMQTAGRAIRTENGNGKNGKKKTAYVIHITSPRTGDKEAWETGTYMEALVCTDQGVPTNQKREYLFSMTVPSSYGVEQDVAVSRIGKVVKSEASHVPEGFIPLSKIFGDGYRFKYDSYTYALSLALQEIKSDDIYVGSVIGSGSAMSRRIIHPPTIYLSPQAVDRCRRIYKELQEWDRDEYVTTGQIADYFEAKEETITRRIAKYYPPGYPEQVLGITDKSNNQAGGHLTRLFPARIFEDTNIGVHVERSDGRSFQERKTWLLIDELRAQYPGFPSSEFVKYVATQNALQLGMVKETQQGEEILPYYNHQIVRQFLDAQMQEVPEDWVTRTQIYNRFGIRCSQLDAFQITDKLGVFGRRDDTYTRYFSPHAVNQLLEEFEQLRGPYITFDFILNVVSFRLQYSGAFVDPDRLEAIALDIYGYSPESMNEIRQRNTLNQPRLRIRYIPEIMNRYKEQMQSGLKATTQSFTPLDISS